METAAKQKNAKLFLQITELEAFTGNTPLFPLKKIFRKKGVELYAKIEWQQMGQSVKARPAFHIIREAILSGRLDASTAILDATSGNTGIAYAAFGAALGIPVTLCLPENASDERKTILRALGVDIVYTSKFESTDGAQMKAKAMAASEPERFFYADQYANDNNWKAHYLTTGNEVFRQTRGRITHFVAGLGTTGTFTGTGRRLKELKPGVRLTALQPESAMHGLEGWKHLETAMVPAIFDKELADEYRKVRTERAWELMRETAQKEGLLISPSSAANLAGAIDVAEGLDKGVVVTVFPDNGEKYGEVYKQVFG